jgi:pimeloyl-ACP methyl ester carboxylesterase
MWGQDFIDALVAGGFYVVAYDARDSGLSTKVTAAGDPPIAKIYAEKALGINMQRKDGIPYFVTDLATDAVGLLDQLGIAAVHVLGFSNTGGSTAERLLIDFSARVLSLTLISASTADWGLPAPPAEVNKAFMDGGLADAGAVDADAAAFLLGTGKIIMKDPMDEARVQPIASASASRCPPDPVRACIHTQCEQ